MKKIFIPIIIGLLGTIAFIQSCQQDIPTGMSIEPYSFKSIDENGGTWKPVLLTSSSQIGIVDAEDVTSAAYQQELADLKTTMGALTGDQKAAIEYWGTNTLIRWDEIADELASKYNLPPTPNADGSYPAPDQNNPAHYPNFPFAHPPYTCRMYAYWAGAEFDALISAWYQKYHYNRPAPYKTDASITPLLPKNDLPSYPSEDAVIASVSATILSAMFPLEKDYLIAKATECKNTRMWAGMNVASDIAAGDSLGKAVATQFLNRSKTDGMKYAAVSKAVSDSLTNAAQAQFGWHWQNLETPQRPIGITPFFGHVKTWFVPSLEAVRPGPPPAPGSQEFIDAVNELKGYQDKLTTEQRDIALFWADGPSTYTPPGHWNRFAADYIIQNQLNPLRTARVFAYLNMSMMDAGISCWDTKYYYHYPRPAGADPSIKTLIGIPSFPSYTSGHSTFSGAACAVLTHMFPEGSAQFKEWADEASNSRKYARIHYSFDCQAGLDAGVAIGGYAVEVAKQDGAE